MEGIVPAMVNNEQELIILVPEHANRVWVGTQRPLVMLALSRPLVFDFSSTLSLDSSTAALIYNLGRRCKASGSTLTIRNIKADLHSTLTAWQPPSPVSNTLTRMGMLEDLGTATLAFIEECKEALSVCAETLYWSTWGLFKKRDIRKGALGEQMYQLGFKALGIVGLLSFLIGMVLALQSAIQLKQFGAGSFLAPMIGIAMIRELGPLLTAIILAGRTGSATTAEIATMVVGEEIDALKTMGINPIQYVVTPKFWAITVTMPFLSIVSTAMGIAGGFLISLLYLELSASLFWQQLVLNLFIRDVMAGILKSIAFSWLIVMIGAYFGFKVRGGAEAVGKETTSCVVAAIFAIIVADAIFSFVI